MSHSVRECECGGVTEFKVGPGFNRWVCGHCGRVHHLRGPGGVPKPTYDRYSSLATVLSGAYEQAAGGKGQERHADDQPFEDQPIQWIEEHFKSFQLGQAVKKTHESQRLPNDAAIKELLGAINYLAARVIYLQDHKSSK